MDCRESKNLLSEYIDGILPETKASMVRDHIARCPDCSHAYESMLTIIKHMNQMESVEEPVDFVESVNARLEKRFNLDGLIRRLFLPARIKIPLELAGVAAAAVLIFYFAGIRDSRVLYEVTVSTTMSMDTYDKSSAVTEIKAERAAQPAPVAMGKRAAEKLGTSEPESKKGPAEKPTLQDVINSLDGKVIESEYREGTNIPIAMTVEIRADKYQILLQELARLGEIQKASSEVSKDGREFIRVQITFQHSGP